MFSPEMHALGTQRSVIRELYEFGKELRADVGDINVYDFSLGNPSVPPPESINAAISSLLSKNPMEIHGYTSAQGTPAFRAALANHTAKISGRTYHSNEFFVTSGAAAALCCTVRALCCPGDEFIVVAPFFPEYPVYIEGNGGKMVVVSSKKEDFQLDMKTIQKAITPNTKAIFINSPNNPTGVVYPARDLTVLGYLLEEKSKVYGHPIYLISDEPYRDIYYGESTPWVPEHYKNTIVCYSYSKSLSIPGQRIGYALIGSDVEDGREIYAALGGASRVLGHVNPPSLIQKALETCADRHSDFSIYRKNRDILVDALRKIGFSFSEPQGGFYLFPHCMGRDATAFCEKAKEFGLLLVPSESFGISGHFRIAYCVDTQTVLHSLPQFSKLAEYFR